MATFTLTEMKQHQHTILAALRCFQRHLDDADLLDIATNGGELPNPTSEEIDALCEEINFGGRPAGDDFSRLHDLLGECTAAKIDGDQLCFPAEWSDAGNLIHLEADEGDFGFELDSEDPVPCREVATGVYEVLIGSRTVEIQPLFGCSNLWHQ